MSVDRRTFRFRRASLVVTKRRLTGFAIRRDRISFGWGVLLWW